MSDEFKPIESQDQLNSVIGERVARAEAKGRSEAEARFADYDAMKTELDGFRSLADDSKTETDKLREELDGLKSERATERTETLRLKIANAHGITDAEDLKFGLTGTDETSLTAQAKWLQQRNADRKKNGNRVPGEGTPAPVGGGTASDTTRALFNRGD